MVSGIYVQAMTNEVHSFACEGYVQDLQARRPFSTNKGTCTTKILELVHMRADENAIHRRHKVFYFTDDLSRKIRCMCSSSRARCWQGSNNRKYWWKCPKYHGHKGDPGVTSLTSGVVVEWAQVIIVWMRAPGVANAPIYGD